MVFRSDVSASSIFSTTLEWFLPRLLFLFLVVGDGQWRQKARLEKRVVGAVDSVENFIELDQYVPEIVGLAVFVLAQDQNPVTALDSGAFFLASGSTRRIASS